MFEKVKSSYLSVLFANTIIFVFKKEVRYPAQVLIYTLQYSNIQRVTLKVLRIRGTSLIASGTDFVIAADSGSRSNYWQELINTLKQLKL